MGSPFSRSKRNTETVSSPSRSPGNNPNEGRTSGNVIREYNQPDVSRGSSWTAPSPERSWAYNGPSGRSNRNAYSVYDPSNVSSATHVTVPSPERIWAYSGTPGRSNGNVSRFYYGSHGSSGTPSTAPSPVRSFAYNGATSRSNGNVSRVYHVSYEVRGPTSHTDRSRIRATGLPYEYAPGDYYVSYGSHGTAGTSPEPVRIRDSHRNTGWAYGNNSDEYHVSSESGWNNLEPTYTKPISKNEDNGEIIKVTNVELNVITNAIEHHTDEFDITKGSNSGGQGSLVIRRGQKFNLNIGLTRDYVFGKDNLRIFLLFGTKPEKANGTYLELIPSDKGASSTDGAYIESYYKNGVNIAVLTPPTCPVGKWKMHIDLVQRYNNKPTAFRNTHDDPIYILFNPWCKDDQVHMYEKDEPLLLEYVLNEAGKIYAGNWEKPTARPWVFGQFTGNVLDCILYLLEQSELEDERRGDPVLVSRKLSALVNSNDDNGVLVGNWEGNYSGGTSPLKWTGSVAILDEYYATKQPVLYAQCWVFSGVLTTACRALGLPARSVSNFHSAHDTDGSITIDTYFKENGEPYGSKNTDSVWNFHVWNDVWMARPDLPLGYGGWQAIDSTPQEMSRGIFRMGPTSLKAVKQGDVDLPFDGKFVFAEVNGDVVKWLVYENDEKVPISIDEHKIGKKISTKRAFTNVYWLDYEKEEDPDREDVTDQYKYPEGSEEERAAVRSANEESSHNDLYESLAEDVTFEIGTDPNTFIGETIKVTLTISNTSSEERTVNGNLLLYTMYYTGATYKHTATKHVDDLKLDPYDKKVIYIEEPVESYLDKLMDHCMFKMSCVCIVDETKQVFTKFDVLRLRKPHLVVKAPGEGTVGESFSVEVSFDNPLPMTLTECELRVEGAHLQRPIIYKQKDVEAYQKFTGYFEMTPKSPGLRTIIIYFNSSPIESVNASHEIKIKA